MAGSSMPDPWLRMAEVRRLDVRYMLTEVQWRALADKGTVESKRDPAGNRLFLLSSVCRHLINLDRKQAKRAKADRVRIKARERVK
jgi:hypothetical protein